MTRKFRFAVFSLFFLSIFTLDAFDWKKAAFGAATGAISGMSASDIIQYEVDSFVRDFIDSIDLYDENIKKINDGLTDFSEELGFTVSQAATQQNVWADACIGKLYPSYPHHFGLGANVGVAHMDTSGISKAASVLGIEHIKNNYYFPVLNADLRLGGLFLPFDVGFSFIKLNNASTNFLGCNFALDFFAIGCDLRYTLIREAILIPCVSLGGGFFYNHGEFSASSDPAEASIAYNVKTAYAQLQVSKRFFEVVTPFIGVRGAVSSYKNEWAWAIKGVYADAVQQKARNLGLEEVQLENSKTVSSNGMKFSQIQPQLFAGVGFTRSHVQSTLSVTADLRNIREYGLWSGSFSMRFKI